MKSIDGFSLAEGPVWDRRTRRLYFCDILAHKLHWLDGDRLSSLGFDDFVTSVHLTDDEDRVLVTTRDSLVLTDVRTGVKEVVLTVSVPQGLRFNDGGLAPDGSLWMGTMRIDEPRLDEGALYRITHEGWSLVASGYGIANGLAFLDHSHFVHVDSLRDSVGIYSYDGQHLETVASTTLGGACPDGLTVSGDGHILVALWNLGQIAVLDSSLRELGRMGGFKTSLSSLALDDGGRLYATSGADGQGSGRLYVMDTAYRMAEEEVWKCAR